jgi:hypothetical protein
MRRFALLAALLPAAACANDDPDPVLAHRFATRPVAVQASVELPDACMTALDDAVAFFGAHGATLTLSVVEATAPSVNGLPVGGVIGVLPGHLSTMVHGETSLALTVGGNIFAAEVVLAACEPIAVAHELGHALGLVHVWQPGDLMYPALDKGGFDLTVEQLAWIAD